MNGRVYDPVIGRFLSPDPNIQFVDNLQSYNRYSYVVNNPLSYTDPTGYDFAGLSGSTWLNIGMAVAGVAVCAVSGLAGCGVLAMIAITTANVTSAVLAGATTDQVAGYLILNVGFGVVGGSLGAVAAARLGGGLAAQMFGGALGGALSGAISSLMQGPDHLGWNMLEGAAMGGLTAGVMASLRPTAVVSEASKAAADGGGGSGAQELESWETRTRAASTGGGSYDSDAAKAQAFGESAHDASTIEDTRSAISREAVANLNEADPSYKYASTHSPRGTSYTMANPSWKCGCFVYDTVYETGARYDHTISANNLAEHEVPPGFKRVDGPGVSGDIVALSRADDYGHAGIVVGPRMAIAAGEFGVERTDFFWDHTSREEGPFFLRYVGK
jgi:hypothetical protein